MFRFHYSSYFANLTNIYKFGENTEAPNKIPEVIKKYTAGNFQNKARRISLSLFNI